MDMQFHWLHPDFAGLLVWKGSIKRSKFQPNQMINQRTNGPVTNSPEPICSQQAYGNILKEWNIWIWQPAQFEKPLISVSYSNLVWNLALILPQTEEVEGHIASGVFVGPFVCHAFWCIG